MDRQVNELAQLPLISHPGASCQPFLGYDWEWAKMIKLCHISFQHDYWWHCHCIGFILGSGSMDASFICTMKCIYNSDVFHSHFLASQCTKLAPLSLRFSPSWPSWEGTHYSYGYSTVPRIQQCPGFGADSFEFTRFHTAILECLWEYAFVLQVCVRWENLFDLSLALVLRNASMFWMPFSFIFWKLVRSRNQVHAVSPAEVIACLNIEWAWMGKSR